MRTCANVSRLRVPWIVTALLATAASPALADDTSPTHAATFFVARISSERTWQHVLRDPLGADYTEAYLFAASLSRTFSRRHNDALLLEIEGNVAYNFGEQHHWELNVAPMVARWQRFPWSHRFASSAACGVGLSYASGIPKVEVELESESHQLLVYWFLELTTGPRDAPWSVSLRLHHRSAGYGLMGDHGGMNAMGAGIRYRF